MICLHNGQATLDNIRGRCVAYKPTQIDKGGTCAKFVCQLRGNEPAAVLVTLMTNGAGVRGSVFAPLPFAPLPFAQNFLPDLRGSGI